MANISTNKDNERSNLIIRYSFLYRDSCIWKTSLQEYKATQPDSHYVRYTAANAL